MMPLQVEPETDFSYETGNGTRRGFPARRVRPSTNLRLINHIRNGHGFGCVPEATKSISPTP
jgi:hypothetical protein